MGTPTTPPPADALFVSPDTRLAPNFTVAEFTRSATAARLGLDNRLPTGLLNQAQITCAMLQGIRAELSRLAGRDVPIELTSGYRAPAVNRAIGSTAPNGGDHPKAGAADWRAPAFGSPYIICQALAPLVSKLGIGQLIHEYGDWVHTSALPVANPVNRIITIDRFQGAKRVRTGIWMAGV